ncbi:MAG: GYF domain-containing protein [Polyangiaceae bacterium]
MKFLCDKCKAKYQIADEKVAGRTVRMKCRKCGHLIEVRSEVTETSVATHLPKEPEPKPAIGEEKPLQRESTGETNTPTAFLAKAARPVPGDPHLVRPARLPQQGAPLGTLAGAFRTAVESEGAPSSPLGMADLRTADEWYVAINGVPVGPILVAEVRRKAALGSVTEDSLVWQDGLDEWRPVRAFPELSATVREAAQAGRGSLIPPAPPPSRGTARLFKERSAAAQSPYRAPAHPPAPPPQPPASVPQPPASVPQPPASVPQPPASVPQPPASVPRPPPSSPQPPASGPRPLASTPQAPAFQASQGVTPVVAPERVAAPPTPIGPALAVKPVEPGSATVVSDPFKAPSPPAVEAPSAPAAVAHPFASEPGRDGAFRAQGELELRPARGTPWVAIAMVAAATAFGSTAAIVLLMPRSSQSTQPESTQPTAGNANVQSAIPPLSAGMPSERSGVPREPPSPSIQTEATRRPIASQPLSRPSPAATAAASASSRPLDTHSFVPPSFGAIPTDDTTESPKAPGQCQSEGQVQQVIAQHQTAIRRTCWERNQSDKPAASVAVALTIGPDGSPQGVSVTGDDPTVAKCIEGDLHSWHFPAMGCAQKTAFSLKFVRQ